MKYIHDLYSPPYLMYLIKKFNIFFYLFSKFHYKMKLLLNILFNYITHLLSITYPDQHQGLHTCSSDACLIYNFTLHHAWWDHKEDFLSCYVPLHANRGYQPRTTLVVNCCSHQWVHPFVHVSLLIISPVGFSQYLLQNLLPPHMCDVIAENNMFLWIIYHA